MKFTYFDDCQFKSDVLYNKYMPNSNKLWCIHSNNVCFDWFYLLWAINTKFVMEIDRILDVFVYIIGCNPCTIPMQYQWQTSIIRQSNESIFCVNHFQTRMIMHIFQYCLLLLCICLCVDHGLSSFLIALICIKSPINNGCHRCVSNNESIFLNLFMPCQW